MSTRSLFTARESSSTAASSTHTGQSLSDVSTSYKTYSLHRLPVPGLWLDILQKIKALGYTGVSFYTDWALLEGKQGDFSAEGVFALEPFFEAAQTAGIYLLAVGLSKSFISTSSDHHSVLDHISTPSLLAVATQAGYKETQAS